MNIIKKTFQLGGHSVTLETGGIARQADGAVVTSMGDTVVLATVVAVKEAKPDINFFPLTVNYIEKTYAAGKIPGGYFKREGRPSEHETLTSRLIDRPLRPLFPEGFKNEVQVICTVLSLDETVDSDLVAMIAASAAVSISGIPFHGPIAGVRVGYRDGDYLLNPSLKERQTSQLDLVVAGTSDAVLMVESQANELSEEVMLNAVMFGHEQMQVIINAINELKKHAGQTEWDWTPPPVDTDLQTQVATAAEQLIRDAYSIREKSDRYEKLSVTRKQILEQFAGTEEDSHREFMVKEILSKLEKRIVRDQVLSTKERIDGRDTKTVRPITIELGKLPRVHGSAVFTRGETQAIVAATLGTERDTQIIDALSGEKKDTFLLHYNFPPFSVGEVGFIGSPKRREIGHGMLAKRALMAVLPGMNDFPYVLRAVSEITESNGSSSMATVCGTSLALMDAGVPIKSAVAGIAMGLIKEANDFVVLTDILGDEDHLGDMDFKVAGTTNGVTALQMDIKITGITREIMEVALAQAFDARKHILDVMHQAIALPRTDISEFAPRITTIKINPDKIRDVIGKGGATIRELTESTGTTIDISDDGLVKIASVDADAGLEAQRRIEELTASVDVGKIYEGTIAKVLDFGAIVEFMGGRSSGLVHISQISEGRVENIYDTLQEGQQVRVKVIEVDRQGRVRLSMKDADAEQVDQV